MKTILTEKAPPPNGHYAQAMTHSGLVFLSMQLPIDPDNLAQRSETVARQTEQVIKNIDNILCAAGSSLSQTLRVTIYLTDISQWDIVNAIYTNHFGNHKPARGVVNVTSLHLGYKIAMDAIAAVGA